MKRSLIYLFLVLVVAVVVNYANRQDTSIGFQMLKFVNVAQGQSTQAETGKKEDNKDSPYQQFLSEQINFNIRSLGVRAGGATLVFEGLTELNGREVYLLTFEATAMNFLDKERIYADKEYFYPIRVTRDLNIWGSQEQIVEDYDQENYSVRVVKRVKGQDDPEEVVIQKDGKIDNIYCFIYRFRTQNDVQIGQSLKMNLPTKDVMMNVVRQTQIKAAGQTFDAYYLNTVPSEYSVWFDVSAERLPLRIDKGGFIGGTSMVLTNYEN
jgi:hypothetical protein